MNIKSLSHLSSAAILAAASFAANAAPGAATLDGQASMQVSGTVKSVDAAKRIVTIEDAQGGTATLEVGANVPNLDKLQSGQRVFGTTTRRIHLTVLGDGEQAARIAQIVSADDKTGVVTLKDAQGAEMSVQASDAAKASAMKAGSRVSVDLGAQAGA
ncbi:hypothetical protein [Caballeronia humi]|uniref:Uncharacterized protein n=1 Tax=Caballeronia humi TaxID=326474 RepID=A0A158GSS5_9BURK|nr:hypothetical protein [Caballeronia humi]SAL35138.1 hypothetical protein AWB65_02470 [Caballeronia humi]